MFYPLVKRIVVLFLKILRITFLEHFKDWTTGISIHFGYLEHNLMSKSCI